MVHEHHPARALILAASCLVALSCARDRASAPSVARPAAAAAAPVPPRCPAEMARVPLAPGVWICVDRWEASTAYDDGSPHSPYYSVKDHVVRAVSAPGVTPQAYISRDEASVACQRAGKRLCREAEWVRACRGPAGRKFPYGDERRPRACNDSGVQPIARMPEALRTLNWQNMNHPLLDQMEATVSRTGAFPECESGYGTFDMVGNLHEWVEEGAFLGGYFLDVVINGDGCEYKTTAHEGWYHDYSTGFRCCLDPTGSVAEDGGVLDAAR